MSNAPGADRVPYRWLATWLVITAASAGLSGCRGNADVPAPEPGESITTELPAPGPVSGTLLKRLSPEETGIVHTSTLRKEREIEFLTMGAGLAAGDYNGDGWVDLYLVSQDGPNKLYKNLGGWRFEDVTAAANAEIAKLVTADRWTERFTGGAHFGDTDDDGDLDLYVSALAGAATLLGNNGDGTFTDITEQAGVGHVGASTSVSFGDYDRDGDLDLYVATHRPYQSTKYFPNGTAPGPEPELGYDVAAENQLIAEADALYRNRGDGTFENVSEAAGVLSRDYGLAVKFTDLDADGWPDLYVANDFESPDHLYINQRNGTFRDDGLAALRHTPLFSMGMDTGDINRDGLLDIVTSDMVSPDRIHRATQSADAMAAMQFHGGAPGRGPLQLMRNSLHLANGNGTWSDIAYFAGSAFSDWTWTMKFADLDLDGWQDVLVTNGFVRDELNIDESVTLTHLKAQRRTEEIRQFMLQREQLLTPNMIFRNRGDLTFEDMGRAWGFADTAITMGLALADLDNDGDLDVVTNSLNAPVGVYRNDADANRIKVALRGDASNIHGLGARLTLETTDGNQVVEMSSSGGFLSGHEAVVVFGIGSLPGASKLTVAWPSGHTSELLDLKANTSITVREPAGSGAITAPTPPPPGQFSEVGALAGVTYLHREWVFDDYAGEPLLPEKMSRFGPGVAWGDADGDGDEDLAIAGGRGHPGEVYENKGDSHFASLGGVEAPDGFEQQAMLWWPGGVLLASLSSVEAGHSGPYPAIQVVRGTLDVSDVELPGSAGALAAADYDGDGALDLFVGGRVAGGTWPEATSSGLFRGVGAALEDATDQAAPALRGIGMVTGAAWSDVDGDTDPDLLLTRDMGSIVLLRNEAGRLDDATLLSGLGELTGRWTGLATADVDGDGDMDAVAANLGLNTKSRASAAEPYVVYAGDVAGDGEVLVIETEWDGGKLYPSRPAPEIGRWIPSFGDRFATVEEYARAPVETVFGAALATWAKRFEARTLAHTLLLNDGQGVFTPSELSREAQLMASYGVVLQDLDGDGHVDIYLVGNFDGPQSVRSGPYDGGISVVLRGDGAGGFVAVPVTLSGLSVPEDAKGLAASDFNQDGWVDLLVGLNVGTVKLFANRGVPGRSGFGVRLVGPEGNPAGVGAKITVRLADGTAMTREVQSGASFLSQDGAIQVFGLGSAADVELVNVVWPDGTVQSADGPTPGESAKTRIVVVRRADSDQP